jgi:hypothetical protein
MNPIIALWSHPRSMSTAIERIMRERGDLDCAHEPFMYHYYIHRRVREMPHFTPDPGHPISYQEIRDMLLERAERQAVFFKDMAYYVMPHILEDTAFCGRLTHCFLIRSPMASILSYHKLDPDLTSDEIGLKAEWQMFHALESRYGATPVVIEAEAVQADTRGVIGKWWETLGLSFDPGAFEWSDSTGLDDWKQVGGWHKDVSGTGGIRVSRGDQIAGRETQFAECAAKHPHLADYLAEHQPFYEQLRSHSLRFRQSGS